MCAGNIVLYSQYPPRSLSFSFTCGVIPNRLSTSLVAHPNAVLVILFIVPSYLYLFLPRRAARSCVPAHLIKNLSALSQRSAFLPAPCVLVPLWRWCQTALLHGEPFPFSSVTQETWPLHSWLSLLSTYSISSSLLLLQFSVESHLPSHELNNKDLRGHPIFSPRPGISKQTIVWRLWLLWHLEGERWWIRSVVCAAFCVCVTSKADPEKNSLTSIQRSKLSLSLFFYSRLAC